MVGGVTRLFPLPELDDEILDFQDRCGSRVRAVGVSMAAIVTELLDQGVTAFAKSLGQSVAHKAKAVPVTTSASPGSVLIHQASKRKSLPSAIMAPHSGVGGDTPRPRKLNPDTSMMLSTKSDIEKMIDELITLGSA